METDINPPPVAEAEAETETIGTINTRTNTLVSLSAAATATPHSNKPRSKTPQPLPVSAADRENYRQVVDNWSVHHRPRGFPGVLFKVLKRLDRERDAWLKANPKVWSEVVVEAWVDPGFGQHPGFRSCDDGAGLWKWLEDNSPDQKKKNGSFTLLSFSGLTEQFLKTLLVHYNIEVQFLYEMLFVDSFAATIHPASENVFSFCFDFLRHVNLGQERRPFTQTFLELDNNRRNHVLSWKWDPLNSPKESDRSFDIARAAIWIRRDPSTRSVVAVIYISPKSCKRIFPKSQAQWRMSDFCSSGNDIEINSKTTARSSTSWRSEGEEGIMKEEQEQEVWGFLRRFLKDALKGSRVMTLHQKKVSALEEEAFASPMIETTRDLYRQKASLDIHLTLLHLQKTMLSSLCTRSSSSTFFWPRNPTSTFGELEDKLSDYIRECERMKRQCNDIQNLIFNTISIEESRAAVSQGRSIGRLTWLTIIFLPLSFIASILGMNISELQPSSSSSRRPPQLWFYFAISIPLLILIIAGIVIVRNYDAYNKAIKAPHHLAGAGAASSRIGFWKWVREGRPNPGGVERRDLERGDLTAKLKERFKEEEEAGGSSGEKNKTEKESKKKKKGGEPEPGLEMEVETEVGEEMGWWRGCVGRIDRKRRTKNE